VSHASQRLKEAEKLGFGRAVLPAGSEEGAGTAFQTFQPRMLSELVTRVAGSKLQRDFSED
jgi:DNA repair protein RadA/Sms